MVLTTKEKAASKIIKIMGHNKGFDKGYLTIQGSGRIGSKQTIVATAKGMKYLGIKTKKKKRRKRTFSFNTW